jgi:hypothetical protein
MTSFFTLAWTGSEIGSTAPSKSRTRVAELLVMPFDEVVEEFQAEV